MEDNKILWFLISLVGSLAIVWIIGSFLAWDMLWFIHTVLGRVLAVIFVIAAITAAAKNAGEI